MTQISLPILILITVPEAILVGYLGLLIMGFRPSFKQIVLIGIFQAILSS
ncbi:MAG: hypothetical protein M0T74_09170 [Desulfitobacterium hafniense]|nr:hypothetical protein [Desulfitobacterium hafniense]